MDRYERGAPYADQEEIGLVVVRRSILKCQSRVRHDLLVPTERLIVHDGGRSCRACT
jgi:hypothetical protein